MPSPTVTQKMRWLAQMKKFSATQPISTQQTGWVPWDRRFEFRPILRLHVIKLDPRIACPEVENFKDRFSTLHSPALPLERRSATRLRLFDTNKPYYRPDPVDSTLALEAIPILDTFQALGRCAAPRVVLMRGKLGIQYTKTRRLTPRDIFLTFSCSLKLSASKISHGYSL